MAMNDPKVILQAQAPILAHGHDTPQKLFQARCREWAALPALRHKKKGVWITATWADYYARARAVGLALQRLGLARGEVAAVLSDNRPEWLYADFGAQCMGIITTGIYPTSSPEQVHYILQDGGVRVVFVENQEQYDKAAAVRAHCPALTRIVIFDMKGLRGLADPMAVSFDDFIAESMSADAEARGEDAAQFEHAIVAGAPGEVAFLVYTSGTTGPPKGAMVTNRNLAYQINCVPLYIRLARGERTVSFLPLCHIAERMGTAFVPLATGQVVHFPESQGTVFNDIREVAPHMLFAPPRFWEKLHSQVELAMQDAPSLQRRIYRAVTRRGMALAEARLRGEAVATWKIWLQSALGRVALCNVRGFLGLQHVKTALTGAAPVPPDLLRWYMALGIDLLEAYGLTETCGFCTATPPERIKIGYAGLGPPDMEIRLGEENELLVRGPAVFPGYWNLPAKTRDALDGEGWLHTGDCGEIDADGYVRLFDRIKDIIITSGGKNITPSNIENLLKLSPYITDAVVVGEGRHFLTCLILLDQENVAQFAQDRQVPYTDYASMTRAPQIVALLGAEIERINARLARVEQLKGFRIIPELLTAEDEELTPTMKLKRRVIAAKYAQVIEAMYASS
jgi:long-chain acyl-CoA synthetase